MSASSMSSSTSSSSCALDSFHHSLGLVLVRLGSLAPIPIGEGGLGGATGDVRRIGGDGGAGAGAGTTAETAERAGGPISPPHDPENHQTWTHHQSQSHQSLVGGNRACW